MSAKPVTVGIIPARGGSQRLKNKNMIEIDGKPLICYSIDAVKHAVDEVFVATDSQEILDLVYSYDPEIRRLGLLSKTTTNTSTVLDSMCHLLDNDNFELYDIVGMFLPTCPLRTRQDVKDCLSLLDEDSDGIISTTDYEFPPELGLVTDPDDYIHCADKSLPWLTNKTRSQDYKSVIRPNGAMYFKWVKAFEKHRNFYTGKIKSYHMPRSRSIDIDTIEDVRHMEMQLELNKG